MTARRHALRILATLALMIWAGGEVAMLRTRAIAAAELPATPVPAAGGDVADRATARTILRERLRAGARAEGVTLAIDHGDPAGLPGWALAARFTARGSQAALLRFADRIETGTPAVRLRRWRIAADGGALRLDAEATGL